MSNISRIAADAKSACGSLLRLDPKGKNALLNAVADRLLLCAEKIEKANEADLKAASGKPSAFLDRLAFDKARIIDCANGLRKLCELDDPVGRVLEERTLYNGIKLKKITVPIGVLAIIYEARPNVTVDAAGLCLKSSNVALLRGSSDAINTNRATVEIIRDVLEDFGIDKNVVSLAECDRGGVSELLSLDRYVDLVIPRGSKSLIDYVRKNSSIPVIETGAGNCCCYIDGTAETELCKRVVLNAKTSRTGVCNALESLLIRADALNTALPVLEALYSSGVTVHGDGAVCAMFDKALPATEDDWSREYLSMDISVKTVADVMQAVEYINRYGTHHSDVILSTDKRAIEYFYTYTDSAVVYSNASTRFTDGGQFGLGAEIGISTQKLHARGPMGLNEIVSYKYIACGDGQIRE